MSSTPAIGLCGPHRCFDKPIQRIFCATFGILRRQLHPILVTVLVLVVTMTAGIGVPAFSQAAQAKDDSTPAAPRAQAQANPTEDCNGNGDPTKNPLHILPAGNQQTDLKIDGITCVVDGTTTIDGEPGSYVYRNVNILNKGTLHFNEKPPIDFHAHSILVEMAGTLEAGAGASPAIHGPLTIWLWGASTDNIPSITCLSDSVNECGVPHDAWVSNPNVPNHDKPMAEMTCVPGSAKGFPLPNDDCFYQYEVFDANDIPGAYFGRKVLAVSAGGNLLLRGEKGLRDGKIESQPADSGTSWARLTKNLNGKETSLFIDRAVPTWEKGDHIVVTTTDYLPSHTEELVIEKVTSDGKGAEIDIDTSQPTPMNAVQFPHWGQTYDYSSIAAEHDGVGPAPDPNLSPDLAGRVETRAIVALLSRSIRIASEGATPVIPRLPAENHFPETEGNYYGGHTLVREGFATYEVQGVEFYQLGQGGAIGRYPVHFHMARSVPQPDASFLGTYVSDSSVVDSMTRFITVHATQGVTLARNVGYKSIGHGFYLEDATETNNRLYSNVGISVRGALDDKFTNPRKVPGILALNGPAGSQIPDNFPKYSDITNPSVFWIQNTWNDFEYNAAVGAGMCGACYWMPPAGISGSSQYETWKSYASLQRNPIFYGAAPMMTFKGNSCSTAMNSLQTVSDTTLCHGASFGPGNSTDDQLVSVVNPNALAPEDFPKEGGARQKTTVCNSDGDCSTTPPCTGSDPGLTNCLPFVIDHYTTSFNWPQTNFAAVWLRGWWYLMDNSAITDVQNGGLTFVTGGGYTRSDAAQGYWSLLKNSILVGNTQPNGSDGFPGNPFASNAGPFTPKGITTCGKNPRNVLFCASAVDGISFLNSNFSGNQRLFNIYDGPASEYNNIYSDVHVTPVGSVADCKPGGNTQPGSCSGLGFMNAYVPGVIQSPPTGKTTNDCILPNAAIAWKQPNGFYYPPAFSSDHLVFNAVDIRHFVIQPLYEAYQPNYFMQDDTAIKNTYCSWTNDMFSSAFTDIDRQTELTDDDGSLTGLTSEDRNRKPPAGPSISVTKALFNNAPLITDECASGQLPPREPTEDKTGEATVDTSPYEYLTTAVVAECALHNSCGGNWASNGCTTPACYGVPVYRQYLTSDEMQDFKDHPTHRPSIRMMGQSNAQRSTLTLNHASYYVDTTVPLATQQATSQQFNVFQGGGVYDFFLLFATNRTKQTYSLYIGRDLTQDQAKAVMTPGRMQIPDNSYPFCTTQGDSPFCSACKSQCTGSWATFGGYESSTGLLTINIDLSQQSDLEVSSRVDFCQPTTYCSWNSERSTCGCKTGSGCTDDKVCSYGPKDPDCPVGGCYGFRIKLPEGFEATQQEPPMPVLFTDADPYFEKGTVIFEAANATKAGACHYSPVPTQPAATSLETPSPLRLNQ